MNCPLFSISGGATFASPVLSAALAIELCGSEIQSDALDLFAARAVALVLFLNSVPSDLYATAVQTDIRQSPRPRRAVHPVHRCAQRVRGIPPEHLRRRRQFLWEAKS